MWDSLKTDCENGRWVILGLKTIALTVVLICVGTVIYIFTYKVLQHLEEIIIAIGATACFFTILFSFLPKKRPALTPVDTGIMEYDPITLENTYRMLRKNLCTVLGEVGDIVKLRKPASLSQLDAPTHYDVIARVPVYHYLASKLSDDVDMFNLVGILQNTIEQKLNNHELDGIQQISYFYNGQAYPSLMVENVRDLGSYVQIDLAIASEHYCRYRENRIYNSISQSGPMRPQDRDF